MGCSSNILFATAKQPVSSGMTYFKAIFICHLYDLDMHSCLPLRTEANVLVFFISVLGSNLLILCYSCLESFRVALFYYAVDPISYDVTIFFCTYIIEKMYRRVIIRSFDFRFGLSYDTCISLFGETYKKPERTLT